MRKKINTCLKKIAQISFLVGFLLLHTSGLHAQQGKILDELKFGDKKSEDMHALTENASEIIEGGLGEPARILLPIEGERVEGGNVHFTMKVDPDKQNYVTVKMWGSDIGDENILMLFIEGKQIGYRHLGDYDMLSLANGEAPFVDRFTYTTHPLPKQMTEGKKEVKLSIRSTGPYYRYGDTFDQYQKVMTAPTKGLYTAYTHTDGYFDSTGEKQGVVPKAVIRSSPGEEVLDDVKKLVNTELQKMLAKETPSQEEIQLLADAYYVTWSSVYQEKKVIAKTVEMVDHYAGRLEKEGEKLYGDSWVLAGPLAIAVRYFIDDIKPMLNKDRQRKDKWTKLFKYSVDYAKTHRRSYTNQGMIVDWFLYENNHTLSLIAPELALPQKQTLGYLHEAVGLIPWTGSLSKNGQPSYPLGKDYYQLTDKGLTKELGFVGGYGEIAYWAMHLYNATGERGKRHSGDAKLREQLLKMAKARTYFRYPSLDPYGYKTIRAEAVIGWRDPYPYPGYIIYGEKGVTRETTPLMVTATTLDPELVGYAQQMLDDNQFFSIIKEKMKDRGTHSLATLLRVPDEYELIKRQSRQNYLLKMSEGEPDFVFSDEEIGVVAIKNGEERFFAALYWRSNYAVNFLARVHYTTPETDHIATVFQDVQFTPNGDTYKRPPRVNLHFSDARDFYPDVVSAHTGEELPIAKVPEGVRFRPGQENIHAGRGDFYTLRYGKYLIGMNTTTDSDFMLNVPQGMKQVIDLSNGKKDVIGGAALEVKPRTTVILLLEE